MELTSIKVAEVASVIAFCSALIAVITLAVCVNMRSHNLRDAGERIASFFFMTSMLTGFIFAAAIVTYAVEQIDGDEPEGLVEPAFPTTTRRTLHYDATWCTCSVRSDDPKSDEWLWIEMKPVGGRP